MRVLSQILPSFRPPLCEESGRLARGNTKAKFYSRSHDAVIRVFDAAGNVIETHEHTGDFKEW
jgi:hypothetical protein